MTTSQDKTAVAFSEQVPEVLRLDSECSSWDGASARCSGLQTTAKHYNALTFVVSDPVVLKLYQAQRG
jgi:hypothetical protein